MPQESLRSVVYRSFVPCDDPKGVVECGTIRKSKTSSRKMEHRIDARRTRKDSNPHPVCKEEKNEMVSKGISEELHTPPPFQLLEVSRGAQKLNQMIDSWSKVLSFDGESRDIAKDVLRGALDLQESLIMLGKLQEASKHMAQLKKKQKWEGGNELGIERMDQYRFGDKNYQMGLQKPRLFADGSSRNCNEELKKVIRDGLSRDNLMLDISSVKKASMGRRKLDSPSDIPSTSSSRSSMVHSNNSASADCSLSSMDQQKKEKGPSLIAKLMGLEVIPPESIQPQLESEKIWNLRRPIFDIDMPKARRPQFVDRNVDPVRSTLKEIIETMQFKGLLKSKNVKGFEHISSSKQKINDEIPPIVIIKPLHFPCLETEELLSGRLIWEEGALDSKLMLRKLEAKETKRIIREGVKDCKEKLRKPDEKESKTKEKVSSNKMKASVPVNRKTQKKEATDKKAVRMQKVSPGRRKSVEKENVKSKIGSNSQDQSTKLRKSDNASIITTNRVSSQGSTTKNPNSTCTRQPVSQNSSHRMKKQPTKEAKPVRESHSNSLVTENLGCKDDGKGVNLKCAMDSILTRTNTLLSEKLPTEEGAKASKIQIEDHRKNQNSLWEVTPKTSQQKRGIKSAEEANQLIYHKTTKKKSFVIKTDLKGLLLSSPSFLSSAYELFDLNVNQSTILQTNGIKDVKMVNTRLFLDCANELMERKSLQTYHPLLQTFVVNPRISISLDQLVEEVCDGVENLRSYSKLGGDEYPIDGLSIILGRDLRCKGEVVNGIWDLGWMNRFSSKEVYQVVGEVEKQVLGGLIEEILTDIIF